MEPLLQVRDLTVHYRGREMHPVVALEDVSFELAAGESLGILGESGCGKTTLALALLGLLPPQAAVQSGAVLFRGSDVLSWNEDAWQAARGAGISMVPQEPGLALNPVRRVGWQVAEVLRAHRGLNSRQAREATLALLEQVGFPAQSRVDQAYPHQLSGGQRQRVVIAQAIACRPALLIADEPTSALDASVQWEIIRLLRGLQRKLNLALMLITHDPRVLAPLAHRVMVMHAARVVEMGDAAQVLERPAHPYTQGLLQSAGAIPP